MLFRSLKLLNILEIELPYDYENTLLKIYNAIDKFLNESRALDGLRNNVIQRIIKALSVQPPFLHSALASMLRNHVIQGKYDVEVSTLISIILSPYARLHEFAMKALSVLSDPNSPDHKNRDSEFEGHIKLISELSLSKLKNYEFKNLALQIIANLALKEGLKNPILQNKGLETILIHFRNNENVEGQRIAAKALLNLSSNSSKIVIFVFIT